MTLELDADNGHVFKTDDEVAAAEQLQGCCDENVVQSVGSAAHCARPVGGNR
jgi:hypothetical protein